MNTWVLCLSRRNAFEWTILSGSRWNGVRRGESSSRTARRAGYDRAASGESHASSIAAMRAWKSADVGARTVTIKCSQQWRRKGLAYRLPAELSLRSGNARDRHAVGRATHVIKPCHVEERDRLRIAPVLAADPELEMRLRLAAGPRRQPHEPADPRLVDRLERAAVEDLA